MIPTLPDLSGASLPEVEAALSTYLQELTAIPANPLEREKYLLFEQDHECPALSSVQIPDGVTINSISITLEDATRDHYQHVANAVKSTEIINSPDKLEAHLNPLATTLSAEHAVPIQRRMGYVEFIEMIRNIDPSTITDENAQDTASRIGMALSRVIYS